MSTIIITINNVPDDMIQDVIRQTKERAMKEGHGLIEISNNITFDYNKMIPQAFIGIVSRAQAQQAADSAAKNRMNAAGN